LRDAFADAEFALEDLPADVVRYLLRARGTEQATRRPADAIERLGQRGMTASDRSLLVTDHDHIAVAD